MSIEISMIILGDDLSLTDWWNQISELECMQKDSPKNIAEEKRSEARRAKLRNYRIEIKLVGEVSILALDSFLDET